MERRDSHRIKRRVPCEFDYEGHTYQGIVVDLSARGLFLQTDTAIEPGAELDLSLRGERFTGITVHGHVVRRRFTPAVLATMIRRGVGLRIPHAPPAYLEALGLPAEDEPAAWGAVEDWQPDLGPDTGSGPITIDIQIASDEPPQIEPLAVAPDAAPSESRVEEWSFEHARAPEPDPVAEKVEAAPELDWESLPSAEASDSSAWTPQSLCRADALLIDQGELDDVYTLLEALGAEPTRQHTLDARGFSGWERPPRLVVAAARSAMRLSVGSSVEAQGIVTIAVVDTASQTLCGMLRRQGFRYVVRRPVHREALRLLLLRALFRGRDRREAPRVPLGCEIALRFRLRRKAATLLELSRTGARVLMREWLDPGDRLVLRIPSAVTGDRPLTLAGRVVRSERRRGVDPEQRVALAMRFDRLSDVERVRLEALIAAHSIGPVPLPRAARASRGPELAPAAAARSAAAAPSERRRARRAMHRHEVLALDPELQRVRHALLGVDLSAFGVRVEPHPELALHDRVKLAFYDAACAGPLVVDAEVARDDGPRGWVLRFVDLGPEAAAEIARIVERAPQIETSASERSRGLVVTELLERPRG